MNKVFSAAITGLEAELVEVEADLTSGLRFFRKRGADYQKGYKV